MSPLILHVEDDEYDRREFARVHRLFAPPSVLLQVPSAERAREIMESSVPTLLVVDLRLPGEQGREFVRWARAHAGTGSTVIVVITGADNVDAAFASVASGADQVILKSVAHQHFEDRIRDIFTAHLKSPVT